MSAPEHNIIIVGAGPVGLFLALKLSEMGISSLVLEGEDDLSEDLRASTFHPPTLEILDEFGLTDQLIEMGRICPTWQIRLHPSHERAEFDLSVLASKTRHPYRLQCEQFRLTQLLLKAIDKRPNVDVRFNARLTDLSQNNDRVTANITTPSGQEALNARILVGADGGRSTIRRCMDFAFDGLTYPETTILATTDFRFEDHLPGLSGINYAWKPTGTFSLLHLPHLWRCSLYPDAGETIEEATQPDAVQRKLQEIVPLETAYNVGEVRPYRIHMRIVDEYRKGRVVLAGDAAHLNSPSGGMGMNGGLHDAYFLSLALKEIEDGASLGVLDRYTRQRRPVAHEQILKQADSNRRRMQERDPQKRREMFDALVAITNDREKSFEYLLKTSMISGWQNSMSVT